MKKKTAFKNILSYISPYKKQIVLVFILALISGGCTLAAPFFTGRAIDCIKEAGEVNFKLLLPYILLLFILYIFGSLSLWFLSAISTSVANKTVKDMRRDTFNKLTRLPVSFFDRTKAGDLMSRFSNDIDAVSDGLLQAITQAFSAIITIVGAMVLMIILDIRIALAVITVAPLAIFIAAFIARRSARLFKLQQDTIGEYNGYIEEAIGNYKIVRAFNFEKDTQDAALKINSRLYVCGQKAQFYSSLVNPSTRFINNIAYVLVGLIGGLSALASGLSIGTISALLTYSAQFAKPLNEVTAISTQLQAALAAAERLFALLAEEEESSDRNKPDIRFSNGAVDFSHVFFSYSPQTKLIEDFTTKVKPGSMVAIVGPTGAGKTTMVNLLMRFYDLNSGAIYIAGQNITDYTRDSVRKSFGMVLQDTWLFTGTIKENITYGCKTAGEKSVIQAAEKARAHSFIMKLENGYDTVLSEDGGTLSQGEKQLLTIARAILAESPMLILDEATSNVDPRTELKIQEALNQLMKNKTSFIIAHRLSTIKGADLILVMNKGQIVETGTHESLLNAGGFYADLYNSQFRIPENDN
ncbi:ABC transporter ATP-binding protein/permease [Brucepastera parasyntrophica]|uniref:ABC transporter ATP-binding protein n=1 Tax=Brucepastera parasyntrophica TaxID=2880008 RepID=UPI00210D1A52|nr:ABC transporter ATP-binding protein [Brucepastera parasyntrophica]ULQ60256.1 ABC transporter ATP-binding protein/permease [Brucepastera parasyntrophica]